MRDHVESVKAMFGLKTDRELAHLFDPPKSLRTIRLWKKCGIPPRALVQVNRLAHQQGRQVPPSLRQALGFESHHGAAA